ncbi:hypothetical protein CLOM_g15130 [Closterium sp. NIES-68]|nr:hypothetical protein CLOM_g15130 [Closterium sp. NIES-68]GJP83273.1 hypothetical protein CLOP_g13446 [Closterium sp. NIES-67]
MASTRTMTASAATYSKRPADQTPAREARDVEGGGGGGGGGDGERSLTLYKRQRLETRAGYRTTTTNTTATNATNANVTTRGDEPATSRQERQTQQMQQLLRGVLADVSFSPHFTPAAQAPPSAAAAAAAAAPQNERVTPHEWQQLDHAAAPAAALEAASFQSLLVARLKHHSGELLRMNGIARQRLRQLAEKTRRLDEVRRDVGAAVAALRRRGAAAGLDTARVVEDSYMEDGGDKSGVFDAANGANARPQSPRPNAREAGGCAHPDEDDADSTERRQSAGPAVPAGSAGAQQAGGMTRARAAQNQANTHLLGARLADEEEKWAEEDSHDDDTRSTTGASSSSSGSVTGPRRRGASCASVALLPLMGGGAACDGGSPGGRCSCDARDDGAWIGGRRRSVGDTRVRVAEGGRGARCSWLQC